jgi:hypothetical protein
MFKLIKLCIYVALGYVAYELYQGMKASGQDSGGGEPARTGSRALRRALNEGSGRMNVSGPARGTTATTTDEFSGASMSHTVGRGVISR